MWGEDTSIGILFLLSAHNFDTTFLAAEDGFDETYKPCSLEEPLLSITTVKWRFEDDIIYIILKKFIKVLPEIAEHSPFNLK